MISNNGTDDLLGDYLIDIRIGLVIVGIRVNELTFLLSMKLASCNSYWRGRWGGGGGGTKRHLQICQHVIGDEMEVNVNWHGKYKRANWKRREKSWWRRIHLVPSGRRGGTLTPSDGWDVSRPFIGPPLHWVSFSHRCRFLFRLGIVVQDIAALFGSLTSSAKMLIGFCLGLVFGAVAFERSAGKGLITWPETKERRLASPHFQLCQQLQRHETLEAK